MASYLLDTHACIFALASPKKLGVRARRALEHAEKHAETVWVPAAAAVEVALMRELGRTEIGVPTLQSVFDSRAWRFLPLDWAQIDAFAALGTLRDPFDRLIVAAARATGSKLISKDGTLQELGLVEVIWS